MNERVKVTRLCKWACVAWLFAWGAMAGVEEGEIPTSRELATLTLFVDNDLYIGTDRYYTHGTRIALMLPEVKLEQLPWPYRWVATMLPGEGDDWLNSVGFALGQNIYTPEDTRVPEPLADDHPYAGWAYLATVLQHRNATQLHELELTLGIIGPPSQAGAAQRLVHKARGIERPEGWEHQLDTEPGVLVEYNYRHRRSYPVGDDGLEVDLVPRFTGRLGNVRTEAVAGATMRFGYNVPDDFHTVHLDLGGYGYEPDDVETNTFGIYGFLGAAGHLVARNIVLDGNTNGNNRTVERTPWVGELEYGIGIRYKQMHLIYSQVYLTEQFREQRGGHRFGSLILMMSF